MNPKIQDIVPVADPGPGNLQTGVIAMANASRFESAHYNEPLTNYTVGGWDRDPLQELLEFYAPAVPVPDRFHYKEARHKDHFLRLENDEDIRAMGSRFGRLDTGRMTEVDEHLDEKGLTIPVDKRDLEENPMAEEQATDRLRRILLRTDLRRAIALLLAAATNTAKTWGSSADPDNDVLADLLTAENTSGVRPNRVGYGSVAWNKRATSFRVQDKAGSFASSTWTPAQLSDFLMVQALAFSEARYRGSSGLSTFIGDQVLMFMAESGLGAEDPSNIKRFTGNVSGERLAVFRREFERTVEITVAHKSKIRITSTLAIRKFTVS